MKNMILGENAENSGRDLMRLLKSHLKYTQKFKMTLYKMQRGTYLQLGMHRPEGKIVS